VGRHPLRPEWWSRKYEYPWALGFAKRGQVVADMGCGWMPRPFKDALADVCKTVYAVDADARLLSLPNVCDSLRFIVRNFITDEMDDLPFFDNIFCLSVLEDLTEYLPDALLNFARLLKPHGRIVVTFDVPYNDAAPCPRYPGIQVADFESAAQFAGLEWDGEADYSKSNCIHHDGFNLTVFHGALRRVKPGSD
jgi:SAM-dependent methyltransferase